ncbi:MAG: HAD-IA family hydrolase [Candidatus Micrarchaeia archaeon]
MAKGRKLLFFDIDDVIFPSTEFSNLARRNALNAMIELGLDADYERVARKLDEVIREKGSNYANHFDYLLEKLGVEREKRAKFVAGAVGAYHNTKASIQPYPDAPSALLKLREKYPLYVASEGIAVKQWDKLICMKLALLFQDAFVSEDLGVGKGPGFYRKIAGMVGVKASECVMVGDREEKDIAPARKAGWKAVRVRRKGAKYALGKSDADAEIRSLSELARVLESL